MRRLVLLGSLALVGAALLPAASSASGATLCVGPTHGCFSTVQAAVDAAGDGDTITVAHGTFAGGVTIDKSINLVGAGPAATTISGGGPVLTVGVPFAATEPTVSIRGLTVTGGVSHLDFNSQPGFAGIGGGIYVPLSANFGTGATVVITDTDVTGNRAEPNSSLPQQCTPTISCPFAPAEGGGIDSFGLLTLVDSRVTNNVAGAPAGVQSVTSNANAGGIYSHIQGTLTVVGSVIGGNVAQVTTPNGQTADAGGIDAFGALTMSDSVVIGNSAETQSAFPNDVGPVAIAGGIHISDPSTATISRSTVTGNRAVDSGLFGDANAYAGGILDEGGLQFTDGSVQGNEVVSSVPSSSSANAFADGGGLEVDGTAAISRSQIAGNTVSTTSTGGFALAQGGGLANAGQTTLDRVVVSNNSATATGSQGIAQGGGIWNGILDGPPPTLTLTNTVVVANRLSASAAITPQGGGVYSDFPFTTTSTVIAGNQPDQCFGC